MYDDSFTYNGIDMYKHFGIKMVAHNGLLPPLRPRKITIPSRSGKYDYIAKYHDERSLELECDITRYLSNAEFDNLKYILSRKGKIVLFDMPDRYFLGQIYDPDVVFEYFMQEIREVSMNFVCEPYAYATEPTIVFSDKQNMPIKYEGTRETPTRFTIRNTGTKPMYGISITARVDNQKGGF